MEKFILGGVLASDELHIINHQHVNGTELFFERVHVLETQGLNEAIHELLGG